VITFPYSQHEFIYQISDCTEAEIAALAHSFFSAEGDTYVKRYSWDHICAGQDYELIKDNFRRSLQHMIAHANDNTPTPWEPALESIIARLRGTAIDWWLTGSCALAVRGVQIVPHDIDLMFNSEDLEQVISLFSDCIVEPFADSSGWVVQFFGVAYLRARIDLAFSPTDAVDIPEPVDFGPFAQRHLESIIWRGETVRVPPLLLQRSVNSRRGRNDRVTAIDAFHAGEQG
jgi:hypothetical protein